ncbi:MAG: Gfo/Idh/MocA family oxidoreductase [Thiotrichaceae bacterium]|nr:Gfo/Idh/MocA family oxidoreductase [Thiotrichaceae bacterium]
MSTKKIAVIGGGRWARVLISVLTSLNCSILWITKHGKANNLQWLQDQDFSNIEVTDDETSAFNRLTTKAIIVATQSHTHANFIKKALLNNIPVLSEKPYSLHIEEADALIALAEKNNVLAAVNFEFMYADYLLQFKNKISIIDIKQVQITWHDPFKEKRHDEIKYSDIYTPLVHDSLPHCWSLFAEKLIFESIDYQADSALKIRATGNHKQFEFLLNRRAEKRIRYININQGEAILDFSQEPGFMIINKQLINNKWVETRPLSASLHAFLNAVATDNRQLVNTLANCKNAVEIAQQAYNALEIQIQQGIELKAFSKQQEKNALYDYFIPKLMSEGQRIKAYTDEEIKQFLNTEHHFD